MTNQEAISYLCNLRVAIGRTEHQALWHYEQPLAEIIDMLSEEPKNAELETHDLISRKAAIDRIKRQMERPDSVGQWAHNDKIAKVCYRIVIEKLERLPSAEPERKIYAKMSDEEFEKWLYEHGICHPDIHETIPCKAVQLLIDYAINELPSAEPQWILCSEKLPEDGTEVFVYLFNRPSPYIAWIEDCRWYTEDFEVESENEPIAWMPLPESYGGLNNDKSH